MGPIKHALIKVVVTRLAAVEGAGLDCHRLNHRIHEHTHTAEGTHEWFYQVVKIDTEKMPDSKI